MKKLSIILFLFCSAVLVSCEEELLVYDNVSAQSFVQLAASAVDLPVPLEGEETISVPISISTISSSERTVTVSVVEEGTTLDPANYTFTDVIIPANSYSGSFQVTGTNASLVIGEVEAVVFKLDALSTGDFNLSSGTVSVRAFLSCDYEPMQFVGSYAVTGADYEVEVTYDEAADLFRFDNILGVGGVTYAQFTFENSVASVDFKQDLASNFGVLSVHPTLGNVYAVNPSVASGSAGDNISSFRTCDNFINLVFRRQIQDGRFFTAPVDISLTKKNDSESEPEPEPESGE